MRLDAESQNIAVSFFGLIGYFADLVNSGLDGLDLLGRALLLHLYEGLNNAAAEVHKFLVFMGALPRGVICHHLRELLEFVSQALILEDVNIGHQLIGFGRILLPAVFIA